MARRQDRKPNPYDAVFEDPQYWTQPPGPMDSVSPDVLKDVRRDQAIYSAAALLGVSRERATEMWEEIERHGMAPASVKDQKVIEGSFTDYGGQQQPGIGSFDLEVVPGR